MGNILENLRRISMDPSIATLSPVDKERYRRGLSSMLEQDQDYLALDPDSRSELVSRMAPALSMATDEPIARLDEPVSPEQPDDDPWRYTRLRVGPVQPEGGARLAGVFGQGFQAGAHDLADFIADTSGWLSEKSGLSRMEIARSMADALEIEEDRYIVPTGFLEKVVSGIGHAVGGDIPLYAGAALATKAGLGLGLAALGVKAATTAAGALTRARRINLASNILAFAGVDATREAHEGGNWQDVLKRGLEGAVMGTALGAAHRVAPVFRLPALGAIGGGMAAYQGAPGEDIAASAATLAALGLPSVFGGRPRPLPPEVRGPLLLEGPRQRLLIEPPLMTTVGEAPGTVIGGPIHKSTQSYRTEFRPHEQRGTEGEPYIRYDSDNTPFLLYREMEGKPHLRYDKDNNAFLDLPRAGTGTAGEAQYRVSDQFELTDGSMVTITQPYSRKAYSITKKQGEVESIAGFGYPAVAYRHGKVYLTWNSPAEIKASMDQLSKNKQIKPADNRQTNHKEYVRTFEDAIPLLPEDAKRTGGEASTVVPPEMSFRQFIENHGGIDFSKGSKGLSAWEREARKKIREFYRETKTVLSKSGKGKNGTRRTVKKELPRALFPQQGGMSAEDMMVLTHDAGYLPNKTMSDFYAAMLKKEAEVPVSGRAEVREKTVKETRTDREESSISDENLFQPTRTGVGPAGETIRDTKTDAYTSRLQVIEREIAAVKEDIRRLDDLKNKEPSLWHSQLGRNRAAYAEAQRVLNGLEVDLRRELNKEADPSAAGPSQFSTERQQKKIDDAARREMSFGTQHQTLEQFLVGKWVPGAAEFSKLPEKLRAPILEAGGYTDFTKLDKKIGKIAKIRTEIIRHLEYFGIPIQRVFNGIPAGEHTYMSMNWAYDFQRTIKKHYIDTIDNILAHMPEKAGTTIRNLLDMEGAREIGEIYGILDPLPFNMRRREGLYRVTPAAQASIRKMFESLSPHERRRYVLIREWLDYEFAPSVGIQPGAAVIDYFPRFRENTSVTTRIQMEVGTGTISKNLKNVVRKPAQAAFLHPRTANYPSTLGLREGLYALAEAGSRHIALRGGLDPRSLGRRSLRKPSPVTGFIDRVNPALERIPQELQGFTKTMLERFLGTGAGAEIETKLFTDLVLAIQFNRTIAANLLSPLKNMTQLLNALAEVGPVAFVRGIMDLTNKSRRDLIRQAGGELQWGSILQELNLDRPLEGGSLLKRLSTLEGQVSINRAIAEKLGAIFQKSEQLNQRATFLMGLRRAEQFMEKAPGGGLTPEMLEFARVVAANTQFGRPSSQIPALMTGPVARIIGQYKRFVINQLLYPIQGHGPTRRNPAARMFWYLTGVTAAVGFDGIWEGLDDKVRKNLWADWPGGVFGALGIYLSNQTGVEAKDIFRSLAFFLPGPAITNITEAASGMLGKQYVFSGRDLSVEERVSRITRSIPLTGVALNRIRQMLVARYGQPLLGGEAGIQRAPITWGQAFGVDAPTGEQRDYRTKRDLYYQALGIPSEALYTERKRRRDYGQSVNEMRTTVRKAADYWITGETMSQQGNYDDATQYFMAALELIEEFRDNYPGSELILSNSALSAARDRRLMTPGRRQMLRGPKVLRGTEEYKQLGEEVR